MQRKRWNLKMSKAECPAVVSVSVRGGLHLPQKLLRLTVTFTIEHDQVNSLSHTHSLSLCVFSAACRKTAVAHSPTPSCLKLGNLLKSTAPPSLHLTLWVDSSLISFPVGAARSKHAQSQSSQEKWGFYVKSRMLGIFFFFITGHDFFN